MVVSRALERNRLHRVMFSFQRLPPKWMVGRKRDTGRANFSSKFRQRLSPKQAAAKKMEESKKEKPEVREMRLRLAQNMTLKPADEITVFLAENSYNIRMLYVGFTFLTALGASVALFAFPSISILNDNYVT